MSEVRSWHEGPLPAGVKASAQRLSGSEGVRVVALMPDAHLAEDVCVGTVVGTDGTLYPNAVGGDIEAARAADPKTAAKVLSGLYDGIPFVRHDRERAPGLPDELRERPLSSPGLERARRREAERQLGTIGSGNHFVELQGDEDGRLWLMLHSGSRGLGQAIRDHHLGRCRSGQ